jgi:hypothetical protein
MVMRRPMRAVLQRFGCRRKAVSGRGRANAVIGAVFEPSPLQQ